MKITEKKLDSLVRLISNNLKEKLGREPTEQEFLKKLPIFLCNIDDCCTRSNKDKN